MAIPSQRVPFFYALCRSAITLGGWRRVIERYQAQHKQLPNLSYLDLSSSGLRQMGFDPQDDHVVQVLRCFDAVDLRGGAILTFARIPQGHFKAARLDGADCRHVDFSEGFFVQASLCRVDARGANFDGANFNGADKTEMRFP